MSLDEWTFATDCFGEIYPLGDGIYAESTYDSYEIGVGKDQLACTRQFIVDGSDWALFTDAVLGTAYYDNTSATGISRDPAEPFPGLSHVYATNARVKQRGVGAAAGNVSTWQLAYVTTEFNAVDYEVAFDDPFQTNELYRYVSRVSRAKGDYLQLNINAYKWVSRPAGANATGFSPGIIVASKLLEYTWHEVPSKPALGDPTAIYRCPVEATILATLGTVNDNTFDGYAAGTLLLTAVEAQIGRTNLIDGSPRWEIKYYFEQKYQGAGLGGEAAGINYIYDPVSGAWDLITTDGTVGGRRLYQATNFNNLFVIS